MTNLDAVILCGGLGTRLRPVVNDRPKGLAVVGGRPFMDILIDALVSQGIRRIILCVGHMKEQFVEHYERRKDVDILFSIEDAPLGTGGAVRNASRLISTEQYLVVNGDSFCRVDLSKLQRLHHERQCAMSMVLTQNEARRDAGTVKLDDTGRIISFSEKFGHAGYVNAGVYILDAHKVQLGDRPLVFSFENELFPVLVTAQPCYGLVVSGPLIDIGTPERYNAVSSGVNL